MITTKINKRIFILGLGISGLSLARYLSKIKTKIICWDDDPNKRQEALKNKINLQSLINTDFSKIDYLVISPSINHRIKEPHIAIQQANLEKVKIITDLEFIKLLGLDNFSIGITGTNGKSTTTKFVEQSLSSINPGSSISLGNIGIPLGDTLRCLDEKSTLIIEASSFQLDKIDKLRFDIAVLLNIANDHIEWHKNKKNYIKAKLRIFKNQNQKCYSIICVDDPSCESIAKSFKKKFKSKLIKICTHKVLEDGISLIKVKNRVKIINNISSEIFSIPLNLFKFTIAKHNFQNLLAAYTVVFLLKKSKKEFISSITNLKNLEHRIEFAGSLKNVFFYNDSKSTNVNSALTAINSFKNIYWILGGRKKMGGLSEIKKKIDNVLRCYVYGETREEFNNFLTKKLFKSKSFENLNLAINEAIKDAIKERKKINILFSPACSSYDQFNNFEQRGRSFKKLVRERINNEK